MAAPNESKGPRRHRLLIWLFTSALAVLIYWLLGFVVGDIGSWPGPSYTDLEDRLLDQQLVRRVEDLDAQIEEIHRTIESDQRRQSRVRESTDNSQQTMRQMLEVQRLSLENDVKPTPEEQDALAEAEKLFLADQRRYQEINDQLAEEEEQLRQLEDQKRAAEQSLAEAREPVQQEFESLKADHDLKVAAAKLAFLIPILIVAAVLFVKARQSVYVWLVCALGVAVALKVTAVMHEELPPRFFKYTLILVSIAIVVRILLYLLAMLAHPKKGWLLKQYREAYESFLCPICAYPIRRGPLRYLTWNRRSIRKVAIPAGEAVAEEEPYTCPACATPLFEPCAACGKVRPSLLPACDHCGAVKSAEGQGPAEK